VEIDWDGGHPPLRVSLAAAYGLIGVHGICHRSLARPNSCPSSKRHRAPDSETFRAMADHGEAKGNRRALFYFLFPVTGTVTALQLLHALRRPIGCDPNITSGILALALGTARSASHSCWLLMAMTSRQSSRRLNWCTRDGATKENQSPRAWSRLQLAFAFSRARFRPHRCRVTASTNIGFLVGQLLEQSSAFVHRRSSRSTANAANDTAEGEGCGNG
jgi:hypothetical protein